MDMNEYAIEVLEGDRLGELRMKGERTNRVREATRPARPLRAALGRALIGLGERLQAARTSERGAIRG
jgi:hypothetical protein